MIFIFFAVAVASVASQTMRCPPNQEFRNCGSACPPTCKDPNPQICTEQCIRGCFCKSGLVKNESGACIQLKDCPRTCPENQVFKTCGTACPPTCENRKPQSCTMQCVRGCFCKPGLVKDKSGNCIDPKLCPVQCPANQEFKECGTACPPTCNDQSPQLCTLQCVRGCFCKPGLVKDKSGNCINPKLCPGQPKCPVNQEFQECGTACPPTCDNQNPQICTLQCVSGCFCKAGLVKDKSGNCIEPKMCPAQCPPNQEFDDCGSACPPTCENPNPQVCTEQCIRGCFCKRGLVRNDFGDCIDPKQCPTGRPRCRPNQEFLECGTACPPTCKDPNPQICTKECVQGCFCKPGLVKNYSGECIDPRFCPRACPPDREFRECGTACPPTCQNHNPLACDKRCIPGCFCKPGLVESDSGECKDPLDCMEDTACGQNERWSNATCVASPRCQTPRCPNNRVNVFCTSICKHGGCICRDGFFRDDLGNCVSLDQCNTKTSTPKSGSG